jgi:CheY-like chemotaxis protein
LARKILLADDSVTAQNMGRKILTDAGYEVTTVNNGSAALKRVAEQRPDLIVLDVYMPGYSGLEVCQRLKDSRDTSRIPILLTVGKLEPFKPEDARRVAADAFIVKPFEASELLSALTRLEDRIVPEGEVSRFSANVSGIDRFAGDPSVKRGSTDEGEQGWKSRIRFPAKKAKKDEPEPEPDYVTPPAFRDLRAGPSEKKAEAKPQSEARPASQEPGLVPDIPRDITPDELDALSALVAKLDGPIPQSEEIAPLGDKIGSTAGVTEAKSEVTAPSPDQAVAAAATTLEVEPESEAIPAAESRLATSTAEPHVDSTETVAPDYTPAPIDRDDEPFFATAAAAVPPPSVEAEASSPGQTDTPTPTGQASLAEQTPAPVQESELALCKEDVVQKDQAKVEEMVAEAVAEEAMAEQATVEERVPTDEELADALRLLTPVHDNATAGQAAASAEQQPSESASERPMAYAAAAAHSGNGSRWTAVPVELSSEEKSLSLEAEMFRAVAPAAIPKMVSSAAFEVPFAHEAVIGAAEGEVAESSITAHADAAAALAATTPVPPPTSEAAMEANAAPALDSVVESAVQESAPTTFVSQAETVDSDGKDTESGSQTVGEQVTATTAASERDAEVTGDQQSMGKHAKADQGKGSKAGWHQIHATTPNASTDVETAKHEPRADESVKTMAAAAASDDTSAPDPNAIASIVDSVLADLRPRIVEEIAKKLSKK